MALALAEPWAALKVHCCANYYNVCLGCVARRVFGLIIVAAGRHARQGQRTLG